MHTFASRDCAPSATDGARQKLLNKEYLTSISQGATEATVGDERLVGVTVRGRF
jgi:hypothetical protein